MRVLYLSYDGALDPLGRSQVVPYLEALTARGHRFDLITFEKDARWRDDEARADMRGRLEASRIRWHPLRYHKRPPVLSTFRDLAAAARRAGDVVRAEPFDLLHARSYPPTAVARRVGRKHHIPYLFDMRGLYPEERVDGGLWASGGPLYRAVKRVERGLFRDAAGVVTLTVASLPHVRGAIREAGGEPELRVIPTCVDLERFRPAPPPDAGAPGRPFTLAYFGSIGTWYLLDEMLAFGRAVAREAGGGRLLFLTNADPERVRERARAAGVEADPPALEIGSVPHEEVPAALAGADATFFFIRPGPSRFGFHQTKFGESLALGLPVAANPGIGDTERVILDEGVGVVVRGMDDGAHRAAARELVALAREPGIRQRCRRVAEEGYDLEMGADRYDALYREVVR